MTELFLVLLRILFPLDPVARLREITRDYISAIVTCLEDPARRETIASTPHLRQLLPAGNFLTDTPRPGSRNFPPPRTAGEIASPGAGTP